MWCYRLTALMILVATASAANGQVVYEPVQSQYRVGDGTFYYGGSNPRALDYATRQVTCFRHTSQSPIGNFGIGYLHRGLIGEPPQYTVSDRAIYRNASVFGYSSVDARNDAYAGVPRFFRMSELTAMAVPAADGIGVVVPALSGSGSIVIRSKSVAPPPTTQPKAILIIPKRNLDPDRVVSAR